MVPFQDSNDASNTVVFCVIFLRSSVHGLDCGQSVTEMRAELLDGCFVGDDGDAVRDIAID